MKHIASGKVREIFELDDQRLVMVATDRISAFDVVFEQEIPDKGRMLTGLTKFWLDEIAGDLPAHLVSTEVPDGIDHLDPIGRVMVVRKAEMLPLEFIVRGRLAGSGWREYQKRGTLHGRRLPIDMSLGDELPEALLTPSTKGESGEHDINLTDEQAIDVIGKEAFDEARELALTLFSRAAGHARQRGLILADTKFEFGYINGRLSVCDEILTSDSSRYWPDGGWLKGETPPAFDKQILRDWLETLDWNKRPPAPQLPEAIVEQTRDRYVKAYEMLTGQPARELAGYSRR